MASMNKKRSFTFEAGADLSAAQFRFLKLSSGQVVQNDTAGGSCVGVLITPADAAGKAVEVASGDGQIVKIVAGISGCQGPVRRCWPRNCCGLWRSRPRHCAPGGFRCW